MDNKISTMQSVKNMVNITTEQKNITEPKEKTVFEGLMKSIEEFNPELGGFEELATLLTLPEEDFAILAPIFLSELEKTYNNVNDKLFMVQSLNAAGLRAEDMAQFGEELIKQIDAQMSEFLTQKKRDFLKSLAMISLNAISETEGLSKRIIQIPIELCHPDAVIPTYANLGDAGMDVYSLEDYVINPGETKLIPTGIKVAVPNGYELQVRPKSGRALKTKLRIANTPGTIDSGYRDEIGIIVENVEPPIKNITYDFDNTKKPIITSIETGSPYYIGKGEKFCQLVLNEIPTAQFYVVEDIKIAAGDRGGGFGSSGLK